MTTTGQHTWIRALTLAMSIASLSACLNPNARTPAARQPQTDAPDGQVGQPSPSPTVSATPSPTASPSPVPSPTPTPSSSPTPSLSPTPTPAGIDIALNGASVFQTIDGFGSSERIFEDPHMFNNFDPSTGHALTIVPPDDQSEVMDKLYLDLGLTRVRPATEGSMEVTNDNSDPLSLDLSQFDFSWKRNDSHVDYVVSALSRGVDTFFLSPVARESWMGVTTSNDVLEYAEWLYATATRWKTLGHELPYLAVGNEPSYTRNTMSGNFIRDVIKVLGPRFRSQGMMTRFVLSDDVRASDAASSALPTLQDASARSYVGALAFHLYDESITNVSQMKALGQQYGLPLWMTEFSVEGLGSAGIAKDPFEWSKLMHELLATYDVSAIDYMWGFFGEWDGSMTQLIQLKYTGAQYLGYVLQKPYYFTGQYSRFVRPGMKRIMATSADPNVLVSAYKDAQDRPVIVLTNTNASASKAVRVSFQNLLQPGSLRRVRTSSSDSWVELGTSTPTAGYFTETLPPKSVVTLVPAS